MNMEIGIKAAQFPEKKYKNGIFVAVWGKLNYYKGRYPVFFSQPLSATADKKLSHL
jgi:hypothetical protein